MIQPLPLVNLLISRSVEYRISYVARLVLTSGLVHLQVELDVAFARTVFTYLSLSDFTRVGVLSLFLFLIL